MARPQAKPDPHEPSNLMAAHFSPDVQRAFRILAAEERTTVKALIAEGLNAVLRKRQRPEVAVAMIPRREKRKGEG